MGLVSLRERHSLFNADVTSPGQVFPHSYRSYAPPQIELCFRKQRHAHASNYFRPYTDVTFEYMRYTAAHYICERKDDLLARPEGSI